MKPHAPAVFTCLALLFGLSARGESAPIKAAPVGVTVTDVTDMRTANTQASECRLVLSLSGDVVADAYSLHQIRITKAVDDLGRDLTKAVDATTRQVDAFAYAPPVEEQQRLEAVAVEVARRRETREGMIGSGALMPLSVPVRSNPLSLRPIIGVRNPSRQSATIKLIEGEIELFKPTAENGGVLRLTGILENPGEFVSQPALAAAGLQLMYFTPESYDAKRHAPGVDTKDPAGPWSDEFANNVKAQVRQSTVGRRPVALFFLHDPRHEVVDLELQLSDGRPLAARVSSGLGQLRAFSLSQPPSPDAQLVVRLATQGALATYPFKLENIPLP